MIEKLDPNHIAKGDMVLYRGDWCLVMNIVRYCNGMTDDVQLSYRQGRTEWVPVTEIRELEKRAGR